jgi:hypothetical protein
VTGFPRHDEHNRPSTQTSTGPAAPPPRQAHSSGSGPEGDDTVVVEGNHYFTLDAVEPDFLKESTHHTVCPWKGVASYFDIVVDGKVNRNAAWYYPSPSTAARDIAGRVAFWHGVVVGRAG